MTSLPQQHLPDDWAEQVAEAMIELEKWAIPVEAIALPWGWRAGWHGIYSVDVLFAMIDKPVALAKR